MVVAQYLQNSMYTGLNLNHCLIPIPAILIISTLQFDYQFNYHACSFMWFILRLCFLIQIGEHVYTTFDAFWVGSEEGGFKLFVSGYKGGTITGDSFTHHSGN